MAEKKKPVYTRPFPTVRDPLAELTRSNPTEPVKRPSPTELGRKPVSEVTRPTMVLPAPVSDPMAAHRRDIERKKREARREREAMAEQAREGWVRVWKIVAVLAALGLVIWAYERTQLVYGDRWPMMTVWLVMATFLLGGIFWMLWFIGKSDL